MLPNLTRRTASPPFPGGDTPKAPEIPPALNAPAEAGKSPHHHADLTVYQVVKSIPTGSRRFRDQIEALHAGLSEPALNDVRGDHRDNLTAVWRILVLHASWGGKDPLGRLRAPRCVTAPTRKRICELVGGRKGPLSVTTYKACIRWWKRHGYLATVREGWSPMLKAGVLVDPELDRNLSQAFVICGPRKRLKASAAVTELRGGPVDNVVDNTFAPHPGTCGKPENSNDNASPSTLKRPLTGSRRDPVKAVPTHAREEDQNPENPATRKRPKKPGRQGAARSPILQRGLFGAVTDGWWNLLTAVFAEHGYTAADLVYAAEHAPDGTRHPVADKIRTPEHRGGAARLLKWRLAQWLYKDGTPLPSPSRQRAERARHARELREARRAELGLADTAARLRAARPENYDQVSPADIPPPRRPQAPRKPATGRPRPKAPAAPDNAPQAPQRPADARPGITTDPAWEDAVAASAAAVELAERDPDFAAALERELDDAEAAGRDPEWRLLLELATARNATTETEAPE